MIAAASSISDISANGPEELRAMPQWLLWRYVERNGKKTKEPFQANGSHAKASDPSTWTTFNLAIESYGRGTFDGIGFVFTADDPYAGVDLDKCLDEAGNLKSWAAELYPSLKGGYGEISPSLKGVKFFVRGTMPEHKGRKKNNLGEDGLGAVEMYSAGRFFTVTGRRFNGSPMVIGEAPELPALREKLFPPKAQMERGLAGGGLDADDATLIDIAKRAINGAKFQRLWAGDASEYGNDHSSADLALCNFLAHYTGKNHDRMNRLFRQSGLYRAKWEREDYRNGTISKAIADCPRVFDPNRPTDNHNPDGFCGSAMQHAVRDNRSTPVQPPATRATEGGQHDNSPTPGGVLDKENPLSTARKYRVDRHTHIDGMATIIYSGDTFYTWNASSAYKEIETAAVRSDLYLFMERHEQLAGKKKAPSPFKPNTYDVNQSIDGLKAIAYTPLRSPCWLSDACGLPDAKALIVPRNGILDLTKPGELMPPTPRLFTLNSLDYDYIPGAPEPRQFISFLDVLWPDDRHAIELLQDWAGYCLTADTRQQKILLLVGPPRSGKGTIARILSGMLGLANVCNPTLAGIGTNFGLWALIGKLLAIISDARLSQRTDIATLTERLLSISGEDGVTIDRKNLPPLTTRLGTRIMILTNELPRLADASGALANRFVVLTLQNSFLGKEDHGLTERLMLELPGILNWAIEGWQRLRARGHFIQPETSREAIDELRDLASPIGAFMREWCIVKAGISCPVHDAYDAWRLWCQEQGRRDAGDAARFGRDLRAAQPGLTTRQAGTGKERRRELEGLDLTESAKLSLSIGRAKLEAESRRREGRND